MTDAAPSATVSGQKATAAAAHSAVDLGSHVALGGKVVAYVRAGGAIAGDSSVIVNNIHTTLDSALSKCRAGENDVVVVMPGHTEDAATADSWSALVSGTRIVGVGLGTDRPTFTWSTATSEVLFNVANVSIENCILEMAGPSGAAAITVAAGLTVSAAGCAILNCLIRCERDADQGSTIAVTTTAAADDLTIDGCHFYGSTNGTLPTTYLRLVGADRLKLINSTFYGATSSATVGVVQFLTTASTDVLVEGCSFTNAKAAAEHAVTGMVGLTGHESRNTFNPEVYLPTAQDLKLAPGAKIASYVHKTAGVHDINLMLLNSRFDVTVALGVAEARASMGDAVVVLPGHTENFAGADALANLVAGTRIIGTGVAELRPQFTWSATSATVLLNVANATIENCILLLAATGVGTTTAPITVSAAGCAITDCRILFSFDANDIVTVGITTDANADDFTFSRNHCHGATAGEVTTFMDIIGVDRLVMEDNYIQGATSNTGVGIVRFASTASTDIRLVRNYYGNLKASSTCSVTGLAAVTGVSMQEHFHYLDTTSKTPWLTSTGLMAFHRPTVSNAGGEVGTEVVGTVST